MEKVTAMELMQYCDGTLSAEGMARVGAALEHDSELQAVVSDLRKGSAAAKSVFDTIGEEPVPIHLARSILRAPRRAAHTTRWVESSWRYAAAILIGTIVGAAGMEGMLQRQSADLRLAGAPAEPADPAESAAFRAALAVALSRGQPMTPQAYRDAEGEGTVEIAKRFAIGGGTDCAEFTHRIPQMEATKGPLHGIACARTDGGWEIIQMPAGK